MKQQRRKRTLILLSVGLFALAILIALPQHIRSQKGAYVQFLVRAKQIGVALNYHYQQHGEWPSTLDRIDPQLSLPPEILTYPALEDLPIDMRDLPDNYPTEQWLYFTPRCADSTKIMVAAPLPFRQSNNKLVRIVVSVDTTASLMDELAFGRAIEK